jgi:hypothetical protein
MKRKRIGHRHRHWQTGSSSGRSLTTVASRTDRSGKQVVVLGKSYKVIRNPRSPSTGTSPGIESGLPGVFDVLWKPQNAGQTMICEQSIASRLLNPWKRSKTFIQALHRSLFKEKIGRLQLWQNAALVRGIQA